MWTEQPGGPGLYWVFNKRTRGVLAASVCDEGAAGFIVYTQGRGSALEQPVGVPADAFLGRALFYRADVPPPPEVA